uniref:Uncharacterized protein n=1 Tax=Rangifer tarandus platyrhynchus TaxID=3082113 RepID=A0ACB0FAZ4_RANTA|nr:unnamed protein product [Rangifer tarandus platyrhynchus]
MKFSRVNQNEKSDSTEQKLRLPAERAGAPLQLGVRHTFPPASVSGNYLSSEFPVLQPPPPTEMCVQDRSLGRGRVSCGLPAPGLPAFPGLGGRSASLALRRVRARSAGSSWKAREATLPPVSGAERLLKPRCRQGRGNHGAVGTGRPGLRRLR